MFWNWQKNDWPNFTYDARDLELLEQRFLLAAGEIIGVVHYIDDDSRDNLRIELLGDEAVKTSQIEGEFLDRLSVQSSLKRHFGFIVDKRLIRPQERGIADMMADIYRNYASPLNHDMLFQWHDMLMSGNREISTIGNYRTHADAMQIVSGRIDAPIVHYEAPPSSQIWAEMTAYIDWFNKSAPLGEKPISALARAGLVHLYFESIHPFEDGNGRIGRALAEKSLAQNIGQPSLIGLSSIIIANRKEYYEQLQRHQKTLEVTGWLIYFAQTILAAQQETFKRLSFYIKKTKFYDHYRDVFNERQEKVIKRIFREGYEGFKGGLSAQNYITITRTSRATATRDLQILVEKGALTRTGERRHSRYWLNLPD